jgi:hypothetical protein
MTMSDSSQGASGGTSGRSGSESIHVANYRPISVTNCFIKILEKIYIQTPSQLLVKI